MINSLKRWRTASKFPDVVLALGHDEEVNDEMFFWVFERRKCVEDYWKLCWTLSTSQTPTCHKAV